MSLVLKFAYNIVYLTSWSKTNSPGTECVSSALIVFSLVVYAQRNLFRCRICGYTLFWFIIFVVYSALKSYAGMDISVCVLVYLYMYGYASVCLCQYVHMIFELFANILLQILPVSVLFIIGKTTLDTFSEGYINLGIGFNTLFVWNEYVLLTKNFVKNYGNKLIFDLIWFDLNITYNAITHAVILAAPADPLKLL